MSHFGGSVISFACAEGFEVKGARIVYCDGVFWNGTAPLCFPSSGSTIIAFRMIKAR